MTPVRDKNKDTYGGGDGKAPVTTANLYNIAEDKASYELSWRVKVTINNKTFAKPICGHAKNIRPLRYHGPCPREAAQRYHKSTGRY